MKRKILARAAEPAETLSPRRLNRALLARQLLLERATMTLPEAVEQVGGLQAQYAPSGYVGLWSRVAGFQREDLTRALEDRSLVQATLMRTTIHIVSRGDYWPLRRGMERAQQAWSRRVQTLPAERELQANARKLREALADGPKSVKELGDLAKGFIGSLGFWVPLVRVPPSGTWERRRADRLGLAEDWVGPSDATEEDGLEQIVRSYLRGFGPAPWRDIASWAGVDVASLKRGAAKLALVRYRDEQGGELLDLPELPLPDSATPAPVRFLPHWDANLLVHARRTGILPEEHRPRVFSTRNPFSVGTYLVDGRVVGSWSLVDGRVVLVPFEAISARDARAVARERSALEAFHG
ncbi:MAG TPA: winged helix DNA-binding domain-containing protein [Candidatus Limnocylindrales bacterium]|nr:winged helix DNA-binding domain-containing protein [Candidatus Limnocylindrales bacterium]